MAEILSMRKQGSSACSVSSHNGDIIALLNIKEWETKFFNRKFGILNIKHSVLENLGSEEIHHTLDLLLSFADKNKFEIVETQLDISKMDLVPLLEDKGLRLVDTRATFVTLVKKSTLKNYSFEAGEIGFATKDDLKEILLLTHKSFTNNPLFYSRFKNKRYFTQEETERYYTAWIENHVEDQNSLFGALKKGQRIIGYSILRDVGNKNGKKLCKAILSAVDPDYSGHNIYLFIQSFLCNHFQEDQFYLDNTTQFANLAIIKNYIKSQKNLDHVDLIFYWTKA